MDMTKVSLVPKTMIFGSEPLSASASVDFRSACISIVISPLL